MKNIEQTKIAISSKRGAVQLAKLLESPLVRFIRLLLIGLAIILIIVDSVLAIMGVETFSQVIDDKSSGSYFVITWIWGLLTAAIFFPRNFEIKLSRYWAGAILLAMTIAILVIGTSQPDDFILSEELQVSLLVGGMITSFYLWPKD